MSDRIDEALDAVEYLFRLVPEHTCYESFDRAVAALATLRAEVARLREEVSKAEQEVEDEIQRRDRYHDAITEAHIALGGDGEWRAHVGGSPPIGESGHLHLDVPVMARRLREQKDGAYQERDQLVAALSAMFPASLERHPDGEEWDDDWRWIVFIDLPTGQATWHIHDSELPMFDHLPRLAGRTWDGNTTPEKYARLAAIIPRCAGV